MSKLSRAQWTMKQQSLKSDDGGGPSVARARPNDPAGRCGTDKAFESTQVEISPEVAKAWLERRNPLNRKPSLRRVEGYARDMKSGDWYGGNDSAISFNRNGVLVNGEHRLRAVVMSETPIVSLVVFNADPRGIDRGRPRSVLDERRMRGEKTSRSYVAAVKGIEKILTDVWSQEFTDAEVSDLETTYASASNWLRDHAKRDYTALVYAAMAIAHECEPVAIQAFYDQIHLKTLSSVAALNFQRQYRSMDTAGSVNMRAIALLTLQGCRNHVLGITTQFIKASDDSRLFWVSRLESR